MSTKSVYRAKPRRPNLGVAGFLAVLVSVVVVGVYLLVGGRSSSSATESRPAETAARVVVASRGHSGGGLSVVAISPRAGATGVSPTTAISVRFSAPLSASSPLPILSPALPGQWLGQGTTTLTFDLSSSLMPSSTVSVSMLAGEQGPRARRGGATLARTVTATWTTRSGSVLRIQQLLAQWGYLPLTWTPATALAGVGDGGRHEALFNPPQGSFSWRYPNTPPSLEAAWQPGVANHMTMGAIVAFERTHGLPAYTSIRPLLWPLLLSAEATDTVNPHGYSYVMVSKSPLPEMLRIWHNGQIVFSSLTNTGIPEDPTTDGTYFVYLRYVENYMSGTNPDGVAYHDMVHWINYFNGSEAVHGFVRAAYGFPQSLGCAELPVATAGKVYPYLAIGDLVTIAN